eukprot:Hpha_TRINITY_DN16406_c3_g8::TRINITY_DN16406_c3_g8_i1::g.160176::m.160176
MGRLQGCWTSCSDRFMRDSDTAEDAYIKRSLTPVCIGVLIFISFLFFRAVLRSPPNWCWLCSLGVYIVSFSGFLVIGCCGGRMRKALQIGLVVLGIGLMVSDAVNASEGTPRVWSFVVLILDVALVFNTPSPIPLVLCTTLIYLAVERMESTFRFGLYDVAGVLNPPCDCSDPPCGIPLVTAVSGWLSFITVLLVDFYLTRGFANAVRHQVNRLEVSVAVAMELTNALARYDVDAAEHAIEVHQEELPPQLAISYLQLLDNLRTYKEYLPDCIMVPDELGRRNWSVSLETTRVVPPPGAGMEAGVVNVGMVFTDIQSSTILWEQRAHHMYDALRVHNSVLRSTAQENEGYEVKVIGDALMLAFSTAESAVSFGLAAQHGLVNAAWPAELCSHPLCKRVHGTDGSLLWGGVRVRIGINWGAARAERNPVTGRHDYFGQTVNMAARVEGVIKQGGLTGITQNVMDALDEDFRSRRDIFIHPFGEVQLRGIANKVKVHIILPLSLASRWQQVCESPTADRAPISPASLATVNDPASPWSPRTLPASAAHLGSSMLLCASLNTISVGGTNNKSVNSGGDGTTRSMNSGDGTLKSTRSRPSILGLQSIFGPSSQDLPRAHTHFVSADPIFSSSTLQFSQRTDFGRSVSEFDPVAAGSKARVALGLESAVGTVVAVRGDFSATSEVEAPTSVSDFLLQTEMTAFRTHGVVVTVISGLCLVSWNSVKKCPEHVGQAGYLITTLTGQVRMGAMTGRMLHGDISAFRKRHVTVLGSCIELCVSLSESAVQKGVKILATAEVAEYLEMEGVVVPAEKWRDNRSDEIFTVWSSDRAQVDEVKVTKTFAPSFPGLRR